MSPSRIALGTAQFGLAYGPTGRKLPWLDAQAIIQCAREHGIDTIDTATCYGDAETRLGAIGVGDFNIVTKIMDGAPEANPSRLGIRQFYAVLMHRPHPHLYKTLEQLKADGITKKIGISVYFPSELDELMPRLKFDLVQLPFNLENRELETSGWLSRLKDMGMEVHSRSVFGRGDLLAQHSVADCLGFVLAHLEIDRCIVGVDSAKQLQEIIACAPSP